MTVRDKATLKGYFLTGKVPTQSNYEDLIDSLLGTSGTTLPISEGPGIDIIDSGDQKWIGVGGDSILLYHIDGTPCSEFPITNAGLLSALAAATDMDIVQLPSMYLTIIGGLTIPTGVTLKGSGIYSTYINLVDAPLTLSYWSILSNLTLTSVVPDYPILGPSDWTSQIIHCDIGVGTKGYIDSTYGGQVQLQDCWVCPGLPGSLWDTPMLGDVEVLGCHYLDNGSIGGVPIPGTLWGEPALSDRAPYTPEYLLAEPVSSFSDHLPNSRVISAGENVTIDLTTPGSAIITAASGGTTLGSNIQPISDSTTGSGISTSAAPEDHTHGLSLSDDFGWEEGTLVLASGSAIAYIDRANNFSGGTQVFNSNSEDYDFKVNGDTIENMLFVDASTDKVGIGTASPSSRLEVSNATPSSPGSLSRIANRLVDFTYNTGIAPGAGMGGQIGFRLQDATGSDQDAVILEWLMRDTTRATKTTSTRIQTYTSGSPKVNAVISGSGIEASDWSILDSTDLLSGSGTFGTSGSTNWQGVTGNLSVVGGQLRIDQTSSTGAWARFNTALPTVVGARYKISAQYYGASGSGCTDAQLWAGTSVANSQLGRAVSYNVGSNITLEYEFTARTTTTYVTVGNAGTGLYSFWDNILCYKIIGGNVIAHGKFTGGGSNGMRIDPTTGSAIFDGNVTSGSNVEATTAFKINGVTGATGSGDTVTVVGGIITSVSSGGLSPASSGTIVFGWDGSGNAISVPKTQDVYLPSNGSMTGWYIMADTDTNATIDLWIDTFANYPPTVADTICGGNYISLSAADSNSDTTLTSWNKYFLSGRTMRANLSACSAATKLTLVITYTK